jgi:flagellar basal body rod protein FlgG
VAQATRYAALLGKRVEAYYRAGDLQMSAVGNLVADNGKSIFVEERFSQSGKGKTLRVEIPYDYIVRIAETNGESPDESSSASK